MPELAEVEFFRRRWADAAHGQRVVSVALHAKAKIFRGSDPDAIAHALPGKRLLNSEAAAKQMLFRFSGDLWLGIHLGMTGELTVQPPTHVPAKHDHLVVVTTKHALVFSDHRMFGRVQFHEGKDAPAWWSEIAPPVLGPEFTGKAVAAFLARRRRAPVKAVLLMQERFPGIGNWMADEILWRAGIHPRGEAGSLTPAETKTLWRECRHVARAALEKIAGVGGKLPPDLNIHIPNTWLFHHRWEDGGRCPKTGVPLIREEIGGRTTCWSPGRQKDPDRKTRAK